MSLLTLGSRRIKELERKRLAAADPTTPAEDLLRLAKEKNWEVRQTLGERPDLDVSLAVALATFKPARGIYISPPQALVLERLVNNPSCPPEALDLIANHAMYDLSLSWLALTVAKHPRVAPATLVNLSDAGEALFAEVVANPQAPMALLEKALQTISEDRYGSYLEALTLNPKTPLGILKELVQLVKGDEGYHFSPAELEVNADILFRALKHPNCDSALSKEIIRNPRAAGLVVGVCNARNNGSGESVLTMIENGFTWNQVNQLINE